MTDGHEHDGEPPDGGPPGLRTAALVRWALVAAMALIAAASVAYKLGWLRHGSSSAAGDEQFLWQCAMHPAIVQDHPGECPICGMTLVRRTAAEVKRAPAGGPAPATPANGVPGLAPVDLTPERIQLIGMRTAPVQRAALGENLHAVGVVAANERGLAQVSVRFSGWVQQLLVAETGRHVKKGEVLATIYSPDVASAEQELLTARGWAARGGADAHGEGAPADPGGNLGDLGAAARRRLELLGIAPSEIDAVVARGKTADSVAIRSPVDGFVTARNVVPGAAVQPGPPLFEVANLARIWVLADVFEQDAARLHLGQKGTLELAAYPGERFEGRVQFIYPTLAATTRTLRVRLELPNRSGPGGVKLRPGMTGNLSLALPAASGLVVPAEALVDTGDHQYVFVATGGGHFEPRAVKAGARVGDRVQIASGVSEGETVVATGNFLVDSESRLRAAIAGQAR
jgi:Cu(I)/Ag(I) efflux system membrane fusion protein